MGRDVFKSRHKHKLNSRVLNTSKIHFVSCSNTHTHTLVRLPNCLRVLFYSSLFDQLHEFRFRIYWLTPSVCALSIEALKNSICLNVTLCTKSVKIIVGNQKWMRKCSSKLHTIDGKQKKWPLALLRSVKNSMKQLAMAFRLALLRRSPVVRDVGKLKSGELKIRCKYRQPNNANKFNTFSSLQLCVNVQIPKNIFGLEGDAVFIDTNYGFTINRLKGKNIHDNSPLTV